MSEVDILFSTVYIDHQKPEWMDKEGSEEFKAIVELARNSMPGLKVKDNWTNNLRRRYGGRKNAMAKQ